MSFFSDDAKVWLSLVFGLFGGAGGGVLTAGWIAVRAEQAKERRHAATAAKRLLATYRAQLVYDHEDLSRKQFYPGRYADISSQLELAASCVRCSSNLKPNTWSALRSGLVKLVGEVRLQHVELGANLPEGFADPADDQKRLVVALLAATNDGRGEQASGLLSKLNETQNSREEHDRVYGEVLAVLDDLIGTLRPQRWLGLFH